MSHIKYISLEVAYIQNRLILKKSTLWYETECSTLQYIKLEKHSGVAETLMIQLDEYFACPRRSCLLI